jgi:HAD superfamily hydrolase (TIGR01493 family)
MTELRGVQAGVFDAYGTLFDFAAAARKCRDVLGDDIDRLTALWRDKQLQYTWLRAAQQQHTDFWQVTGDALDFALETSGLKKSGLRDRLMSLYPTLDPFPEVPNVLRKLKAAGIRTAILSNGSPNSSQKIEVCASPTITLPCIIRRRKATKDRHREERSRKRASSGRIPKSAWTDMCPDRRRSNEGETAYEYQT